MESLLSNLKILDFTQLLPGPYATMLMADLGADVIRVEPPGRPDLMRGVPPFDDQGTSAWHACLNRSKRSILLNLKKPESLGVVRRLVQEYDIVVEQFRPGVMDRLGIGYQALKEINPGIIYCSITGYGQSGPWRDRAGHDNNYLATAGMVSVCGRKGQAPPPLGFQIADVAGGSHGAVMGILAAVIHRSSTGKGQSIDISMFDASLYLNMLNFSPFLTAGEIPEAESGWLNGGGFYDFYQTSDGRAFSLGGLETKFWKGFCKAIGREDLEPLAADFSPETARHLKSEIAAVFASRSYDDWKTLFSNLDLCVEPVLTVAEAAQHPQVAGRDMIVDVPARDGSHQRQVACPYRFSETESVYRHIGAEAGEHTRQILEQVGFSEDEIRTMSEKGCFG